MLEDLFHETPKDIYFAKKQILKALPKLAKSANSDRLRNAFETHPAAWRKSRTLDYLPERF